LLLKAWQVGGQVLQQRLIELLFQAQFEQNEDIGDVEMLSNRAERAGLMSEDAVRYYVPVYLCMFLWS
jgi:predicted DsbA family dithiol-disulfide isomerase